ncbi:MAG TPA: hypothetical protein VMJ32_02550 [Pirellulales bacterium]|nr:hypothetical protein [Pirellulales bacterium]
MNRMPLIVYESTGDWAAALGRRLPRDISLIETRSLAELWEYLTAAHSATVALELRADRADTVLAAVVRLDREFPQAAAVVLADRDLAAWEGIMREAGAVHFITSPRRTDEVIELARRHTAAATKRSIPSGEETTSLEDQIFASMPWG